MKNYTHPEFLILHKLQLMLEKNPEQEELLTLIADVRDIINENSLAMVQTASLYALLGKPGDLTHETKHKLRHQLSAALRILDLDDEMEDQA